MNAVITLAATLLRTLATIPANSVNRTVFPLPHIESVLNAVASVLEVGDSALPQLQALHDHIVSLLAAHQDPTEADFAELKKRSDAASAVLQS